MKTSAYLSLLLVFVCNAVCFAQLNIICNDPACGGDVGPGGDYSYVASNLSFTSCPSEGGFPICKFKWEVENGIIKQSNSTTWEGDAYSAILVNWNNTTGTGKVKVTVSNSSSCSSCGSGSKEITQSIVSLGTASGFDVNGSYLLYPYKIACGTAPITVSIDPVTNANSYVWQLPPGWTKSGSGNSITVYPNATGGGLLKVTAKRLGLPAETSSERNITRPTAGEGVSLISGPEYLCSGSSSYTLSGVPAGTSLNWSLSGGSVSIPGGSTASSVTATFSYSGKSTLTADITDGCGTASRVKDIQAGVYSTSQFSVSGPSLICPFPDETEVYVSINVSTALSSIDGYNWTYSSNFPSGYSPSGNDYKLVPPNPGFGSAWVKLSIQNTCGWSIPWQWDISEASGCSGGGGGGHGRFVVSPNPASESLTLLFVNKITSDEIPENISLFSEKTSQLVKTYNSNEKFLSSENKIHLKVSDLEKGTYFLHVTDSHFQGDKTKKTKVIIQ